jgi:hypothetical protein
MLRAELHHLVPHTALAISTGCYGQRSLSVYVRVCMCNTMLHVELHRKRSLAVKIDPSVSLCVTLCLCMSILRVEVHHGVPHTHRLQSWPGYHGQQSTVVKLDSRVFDKCAYTQSPCIPHCACASCVVHGIAVCHTSSTCILNGSNVESHSLTQPCPSTKSTSTRRTQHRHVYEDTTRRARSCGSLKTLPSG